MTDVPSRSASIAWVMLRRRRANDKSAPSFLIALSTGNGRGMFILSNLFDVLIGIGVQISFIIYIVRTSGLNFTYYLHGFPPYNP